ncbi:hypothetical protein HMPREF7215_2147 [Pyramidobacter piscolens W5455]|uniref:Uncharacterized protein n=1 Tax=Pyramidobacter piscolens W5455 TaxID=352165 RepID=A0ABM9ZUB6_9BACT|nr:hypothetical protein HMPREF7215_2147 [Pyramidobacter piscolens W5455]
MSAPPNGSRRKNAKENEKGLVWNAHSRRDFFILEVSPQAASFLLFFASRCGAFPHPSAPLPFDGLSCRIIL